MFQGCKFRTAVSSVLALGGLFLISFVVHQLVFPIAAWVWPSLQPSFYDLGVYGAYSPHQYVSFNVSSPRISHLQWDDQCDHGFTLLTPQGDSVKQPGPAVLDGAGNLVWMSAEYGTVANLKVQEYQGHKYLTFWAGHKAGTFGQGIYHMLDSTYQSVLRVSAVGLDLFGDLHEFKITKDGTALMTVYNVTNMDLTSMGRPKDGWIIDSLFQEIDIATGDLLFQWRASDHFTSEDSYATNPLAGYWQSTPFDFFHINSVDKDSAGNYIVSSRHTHTVTCISPTGETLWILGGHRNHFKDLSNGRATDFKWQHDARWVSEEEGTLSLFDNGEAGPLHIDAPYSSGRMIRLDIANRSATLLHSYVSSQQTRTPSQGSVQVIPENGNVFVGWGHSAAFSEFNSNGTLICETHFGASWFYYWGRIVSYRASKAAAWVGTPEYPPTAETYASNLYVSWNGATEVVSWELQGVIGLDEKFEALDVMDKIDFETSFTLPDGYTQYRVAALDRNGDVLRYSNTIEWKSPQKLNHFLFIVILFVGLIAGAQLAYRIKVRRVRRGLIKYSPL